MKKIVLFIWIFSCFFCQKAIDYQPMIQDFFEKRKEAYEKMDENLMMKTFYLSNNNTDTQQMKKIFYEKYFKMAQDYQFEYEIIGHTKKDSLIYVRYNYKLNKNMNTDQGKGFSQSFKDQLIILIQKEGILLEYVQE